jgi:hypothetical protein
MEYLEAWGTLIHEKNLKSKISCQTPFKEEHLCAGRYAVYGRDAELTCEFPIGSQIISNIIWEKDGDRSACSNS